MWPKVPPVGQSDIPVAGSGDEADTDRGDEQELSWEDWPVQAKLAMVLDYLRQQYYYCSFCGCQVTF